MTEESIPAASEEELKGIIYRMSNLVEGFDPDNKMPTLGNKSGREAIMSGDTKEVYAMLFELESGMPG